MDREKILETIKEIRPGQTLEIGQYDLTLINEINSILRERGYKATYYGEYCILCIFGPN